MTREKIDVLHENTQHLLTQSDADMYDVDGQNSEHRHVYTTGKQHSPNQKGS